jgi:RNA polymerase sigma-70 factor (ECF subfamily)
MRLTRCLCKDIIIDEEGEGTDVIFVYFSTIETQEDRDILTSLYEKYKGLMFRIANKILEDPHASEDIVHDAFVRIIKNIGKLDSLCDFKTKGLVGIVVSGLAKDEYRRRKRLSLVDDIPEEMLPTSEATDEIVICQEQYEELKTYIKQLNTIYSHIFLLRYDYGFSTKEIAELTGVSEDTVRQRIHRAKKKMRILITKEWQTT